MRPTLLILACFAAFSELVSSFPSPYLSSGTNNVNNINNNLWHNGPNVCSTDLNIPSGQVTGNPSVSNCYEQGGAVVCQATTNVNGIEYSFVRTYTCCNGFTRQLGGSGCVEVDVKTLIPTMRNLKCERFVQIAENLGFEEMLHSENFTVFCPPDESLEDFLEKHRETKGAMQTNEIFDYDSTDVFLWDIVTLHIVKGFVRFHDVSDQAVLLSENPQTTIRVEIYYIPDKLVTANCVPLTTTNNLARNGVVHNIAKVLPIPSKTVADIIASNPEFSILKGMLSRAGLVQYLRNPSGNFTLFAPTDSAFDFHYEFLDRFMPANSCVTNLMKNHILEHVICSTTIPSYAETMNMLGELLSMSREVDSKIYVNNIQVVVKDLVGTNGVVHIIDGVLVPRQAKALTQVLQESHLFRFLDLLDYADLKTSFDRMENVTFFVPSNDAITKLLRSKFQRLSTSNESLQEILRYHAAKSLFLFNSTQREKILETQAEDSKLRIRQYSTFPFYKKQVTVQCARVLSPNNQICGSVLHVIDRLLLPSKSSVMEIIKSTPEFSYISGLLSDVGLDYRLAQRNYSFTLFAPIDDVFKRMPASFLHELKTSRRKATEFLKMHILSESLCCDQLMHTLVAGRHQVRSIDGSLLRVTAMVNAPARIGHANIIECDKTADNGVVHSLDNFVYLEKNTYRDRTYFDNLLALL